MASKMHFTAVFIELSKPKTKLNQSLVTCYQFCVLNLNRSLHTRTVFLQLRIGVQLALLQSAKQHRRTMILFQTMAGIL